MIRKSLPDWGAVLLLLLFPLLLFAPVALGPRTLLPADVLYLFEPYRAAADDLGVTYPQNHLVADLILENYAWKHLLVEAIHNRELPLWDPYIFAGHPFLANGQHSALYPLSIVFYVLPLWRAYGVFAWLQLGLAGIFAYLFARVLGISRLGGLVAGMTFQFSGFMVVSSAAHPMIVAGSSWLPFILAMVELVIQQRPALGRRPATLPWALLGAVGIGCQMLAGHAENTYFVLLVTVAYAGYRQIGKSAGRLRPIVWLTLMIGLGLALGAVQFIPLYEVVNGSFRSGEAAATLEQVRGWAYPVRRLITFGIPNFFGNPAHHGYFDIFTYHWTPAPAHPDGQYIDWGIKNYVEGGAYLGLLPSFLAVIGVLGRLLPRVPQPKSRTVPFFALLSLFSLGCVFGTPIYALVYALPGLEQSHSPFRWVFPLSLAVAILAGFGVETVRSTRKFALQPRPTNTIRVLRLALLDTRPSLIAAFAAVAFWSGVGVLTGLIAGRVFFARLEPLITRVFLSLAKAPEAFPDVRAFYSYEFKWIALFGLLLTGTGIVLRVSRCPIYLRRRPVWEFLAVGLLLLDFVSFGAGFNPAVDPALLDYVPPVVEFLRQDTSVWRYATFTPPGTTKTLNANTGMFYDLPTVDGYDSLFTRQYARYMGLIEEQGELQYNRIASFHQWPSLDSPLTDLLNVKYIVTEVEIPSPKYRPVYRDEAVRVYENLGAMPRAFTLPLTATLETDDLAAAVQTHDPRHCVILDGETPFDAVMLPQPAEPVAQKVARHTLTEVLVEVQTDGPAWLILTDAYFPGWKAFLRPAGADEGGEQEVTIYRVDGVFRGVLLERPGAYLVRFKYSPDSVKIGAFISFVAGMLLLFLTGLYLWRFFYREEDDANTVRRVAKNSLAPIVLNLFNQLINIVFVALMARILGPVGTGRYFTAVIIYGWFDIVANFGLEMYLMRAVARDRANARRVFVNTTVLRVLLFVATIPLLAAFLAGRQAVGRPLAAETVWAVALLYAGLLPGTVANGLTGLFRGCEKHEYPAAVQTITTIVKVTLGVLALVLGRGVVGVAATVVLTNLTTMTILAVLAYRLLWPTLPRQRMAVSWPLQRDMLVENWPLMASLLLQVLFPGVNGIMLQFWRGDRAAGLYDAGRKWMDNLNFIPAIFSFAVFPVVSRQAKQDRAALLRTYRLAVKLLVLTAFPAAVLITLLADVLVGALSGSRFLPDGAAILRILIWSIVFGWVNSLTNYVLIALDRQRYVLWASGVRVLFTVVANLLFVRRYGYFASAWIIIAGELLLAVLFAFDMRRQVGPVRWGATLTRPVAAGLTMAAVAGLLAAHSVPLAVAASPAVYLMAVVGLRAFTPEEWGLLAPLLPLRREAG